MKVLIVTNLYPPDVLGGYEIGCSQVVRSLQERSIETRVLTTIPRRSVPSEAGTERSLRLTDIYVNTSRDALINRLDQFESQVVNSANVYALLKTLEDFEPDVAYLWNLMGIGGLSLFIALRQRGVPCVWHLMDPVPSLLLNLEGPISLIGQATTGHLDKVHWITCSQRVIDEVRASGLTLRGPIHLIPNWTLGYPDSVERRPYREDGVLRVLSAGRVSRDKGSDVLVEAAALLKEWGYSNFSIDLFGTVGDSSIYDMITTSDVGDLVKLKGFRAHADMLRTYSDYDVFAFPTWKREPFAFSPLEAATLGCVNLISRDCGNAEWMVDGVHCLKAERTGSGFAQALRSILDGDVPLEPIGERAKNVVSRDFHLGRLMPKIENVLREAISTNSPDSETKKMEVYHLARLTEMVGRAVIEDEFERGTDSWERLLWL